MRIAVIDIGSNSIKLLVAEIGSDEKIVPLRREKAMVRLGHETLLKGQLSSEAIVVAIRTLAVFKTLAASLGAHQIIAIATASVREARNAPSFIKEVLERTGIQIEVLSGVEEARLIGVAASHYLAKLHKSGRAAKPILNIDIGGGSTEISLMQGLEPLMLHSMRIGAVRLTEEYLQSDPPRKKELESIGREIDAALERPLREMKGMSWQHVSGTSGTILALAAAIRSVAYPETETVAQSNAPALTIRRTELAEFNEALASLPVAGRKRIAGLSEQRAEIIIAGGLILEHTMRALKINELSTCSWSLREGVLLDRLGSFEGVPAKAQAKESDARLAGAYALGEKFNYEAAHAKHVMLLSLELFDQLRSLHRLGDHERTLLAAAAALHDIGYAISHESHHKHSLYLILNSELTGFTDLERLIIANVARYHRKAFPREQHAAYAQLGEEDRRRVWLLSGIVRVADALDRSHQSRVRHVKASARSGRVRLSLSSSRRCDHELWALAKKKDLFEHAFGVTLEAI